MKSIYYILIGVGVLVALVFSLLVLVTGKGDAMSGGGGVRTSFKGKATHEDMMSRLTLTLGIAFMAIALVLEIMGNQLYNIH